EPIIANGQTQNEADLELQPLPLEQHKTPRRPKAEGKEGHRQDPERGWTEEMALEDIIEGSHMRQNARRVCRQRCHPQIVGASGSSPDEDNLVLKYLGREQWRSALLYIEERLQHCPGRVLLVGFLFQGAVPVDDYIPLPRERRRDLSHPQGMRGRYSP